MKRWRHTNPAGRGWGPAAGPKPVGNFVIRLSEVPPSTNNLYENRAGGRRKASRYAQWITAMGTELMVQRPTKHEGRVSLQMVFGFPDKRPRDAFNYVKAVEDLLVRHGVIQDDNTRYVRGGSVALAEDIGMDFTGVQIVVSPAEAEGGAV